jgi:hypothetical protein
MRLATGMSPRNARGQFLRLSVIRRFWRYVTCGAPDACWLWQGSTDGRYGELWVLDRRVKAHRPAWMLHHRQRIPRGFCVLHHCDTPACVNPAHLFLGTQAENIRDAITKGRHIHGERVGSAKLTQGQVLRIEWLYRVRGFSQHHLARRYGVTQSTIGSIVNGKTWVQARIRPAEVTMV